jgi:hypothetical protein
MITGQAVSNGFSGESAGFVQMQDLIVLSEQLAALPFPDQPIRFSACFDNPMGGVDFDDGMELFFVKLGRWEAGVRVHLRSSLVGVDDPGAVHDVRLFVSTTSAKLEAFGRELANLADGTFTEVTLPGWDS